MSPLQSTKQKLLCEVRGGLSGFPLNTAHGPRSVADRIEDAASSIAKASFGGLYTPPRSARSPEDFSLLSGETRVYVDVKTHFVQETAGFSMPNLVSISKLRTILEDPSLALLYMFVDYSRGPSGDVSIQGVESAFVWELDWGMLRIGALGRGQLQIANANKSIALAPTTRGEFLRRLKLEALKFYDRQSEKMRKERKKWVQ